MIDSVNLFFIKHRSQFFVEFARAFQIGAERFLDNNARPASLLWTRQFYFTQLLCNEAKEIRQRCEVINAITLGLKFVVDLFKASLYVLISLSLGEVSADVEDTFGKAVPRGLIERLFRAKFLECLFHQFAKLVIAQGMSGRTKNRKLIRN